MRFQIMSYCRKCGAKLDEDAKFCRVCGSPVTGTAAAAQAPMARRVRRPFILPVAILIALLGVAFVFAVFAFVPFQSVNFNQSNSATAVPGVDTVNLNFQADVADVNVIPTSLSGDFVRVDVSASGSTGLFGSTTHPVQVTFSNETSDGTMTVTSKVTREELWPFSFNLHVVCNVYVDTSAVVNVTAQTTVGKVALDTNFLPVTFDAVNLHSTTGSIQATLSPNAVFKGNISASSTTGGIQFVWSNAKVSGNTSISLASTTGAISADISQTTGALGGNVALEARTTTGNVECAVTISDSVGSQITSHTSTGSISVDGT